MTTSWQVLLSHVSIAQKVPTPLVFRNMCGYLSCKNKNEEIKQMLMVLETLCEYFIWMGTGQTVEAPPMVMWKPHPRLIKLHPRLRCLTVSFTLYDLQICLSIHQHDQSPMYRWHSYTLSLYRILHLQSLPFYDMKSSMLLPTYIRVFDIWFLWVAKYYFELCSDLAIPLLKMLYKLYYVTVVNKTETETGLKLKGYVEMPPKVMWKLHPRLCVHMYKMTNTSFCFNLE